MNESTKIKSFNHTLYEEYFLVARTCSRRIAEIQARPAKEIEVAPGGWATQESIDTSDRERLYRLAVTRAIFAALTLESFINDYGFLHFAQGYYEENLDPCKTATKWQLFPKLVKGRELAYGGDAIRDIRALFKLRNQLVHNKTKKVTDGTPAKNWDIENHALECVADQIVTRALKELKAIDPEVEIDWAFRDLSSWESLW